MNNAYQQKPDDKGVYAGPGIRGLSNAHKLGMSWGAIALVVGLMVVLFVGYTAFMMKAGAKQNQQAQDQVDAAIQKAQEDSLKMQAQIEADVQRKIKEAQEKQ